MTIRPLANELTTFYPSTAAVVEIRMEPVTTRDQKAKVMNRHMSYFVDAVFSTLFLFLAMAWFYNTFPGWIKSHQAVFLTFAMFPLYFPRPRRPAWSAGYSTGLSGHDRWTDAVGRQRDSLEIWKSYNVAPGRRMIR